MVHEQFREYRASLRDDQRHLLERFEVIDMARKVVGVGSVGTRAFIVLLQGRDQQDPLFLQVKEATKSVLEDHLPKSRYRQPGERVVQGQRMMQAASDIYLGWSKGAQENRYLYWRQLRDMKVSATVETMGPGDPRRVRQVLRHDLGPSPRPLRRPGVDRRVPRQEGPVRPVHRRLLRTLRRPERPGLRRVLRRHPLGPPPSHRRRLRLGSSTHVPPGSIGGAVTIAWSFRTLRSGCTTPLPDQGAVDAAGSGDAGRLVARPSHRRPHHRGGTVPAVRRARRRRRGAGLRHLPRRRAPLQRVRPLVADARAGRGGRAHHDAAAVDGGQPPRPPRPGPHRRGLRHRRRAVRRPGRADRRAGRLPRPLPAVRPVVGRLRGHPHRGRRAAAPPLDRGARVVVGLHPPAARAPSPPTLGRCNDRIRRCGSRPARSASVARAVELGCPIVVPTISTGVDLPAQLAAEYREGWARAGHDPSLGRIGLHVHCYVGDGTTEEARERVAPPPGGLPPRGCSTTCARPTPRCHRSWRPSGSPTRRPCAATSTT